MQYYCPYWNLKVCLFVRGGLRREILVKNDILNFENAFSSCFAHFQASLFVRGGLRRKILVKNDIINVESALLAKKLHVLTEND